MLELLFILLLTGVCLLAFLWLGTYFFQGYIYTEATQQIHWQAPAAAGVLTLFLAVWCFINVAAHATPTDIPFDTLFRFSPEVTMFDRPAPTLWAIKKTKKLEFQREQLNQTHYRYREKAYDGRPWSSSKVEAIELKDPQGQIVRFNRRQDTSPGAYQDYVSDDGWSMRDYDDGSPTSGPTGLPSQFRLLRLLANGFFNFGFLTAWFLCLWLLLRFQWPHALGLAIAIWVLFTLTLLPMLLSNAASLTQGYRPPTSAGAAIEAEKSPGGTHARSRGMAPLAAPLRRA